MWPVRRLRASLDEIEFYPDGYASERGGLVEFVSAELRYAFFANARVSPYAVVGVGRGVERPNVNESFRTASTAKSA